MARKRHIRFEDEQRERFLTALRVGDSVIASARLAGVSRAVVYQHKAANPGFAAAWEEAEAEGVDYLVDRYERALDTRAVDGWLEPVFWQGQVAGAKRKFSDTLLLARLRALAPHKYRDNVDITTNSEAFKPGVLVVPGMLSPEQWGQAMADYAAKGPPPLPGSDEP